MPHSNYTPLFYSAQIIGTVAGTTVGFTKMRVIERTPNFFVCCFEMSQNLYGKKSKKFGLKGQMRLNRKCHNFIYQITHKIKIFKMSKYSTVHPEWNVIYDLMFGLTVYEFQHSKVTSASQNQKIIMRDNDNSKNIVLLVLKLSQSSSEPKSTPWTNFRQNLRHEGVKFE